MLVVLIIVLASRLHQEDLHDAHCMQLQPAQGHHSHLTILPGRLEQPAGCQILRWNTFDGQATSCRAALACRNDAACVLSKGY